MVERQAEDTIKNTDIDSSTHKPAYNTRAINHALTRANKDQKFLDSAIKLLDNKQQMQFPAIKEEILDYISRVSNDTDVISLFQSLDGYIRFKDVYHVRKALEENNPVNKTNIR
jgi:hypothetical protein